MRQPKYAIYPLWPDVKEDADDMIYARVRAMYFAEKYDVPIAIKKLEYVPTVKEVVGTIVYYVNARGKTYKRPPRSDDDNFL